MCPQMNVQEDLGFGEGLVCSLLVEGSRWHDGHPRPKLADRSSEELFVVDRRTEVVKLLGITRPRTWKGRVGL